MNEYVSIAEKYVSPLIEQGVKHVVRAQVYALCCYKLEILRLTRKEFGKGSL